ncbi:transporter substrate-binding domain-containing protein [Bradyrhizobium sp. Pha-3]|uniref:transporter substrate-binding domain-containing protein n=1 Tax=Bradyrhizobium sp. Pha-3 TaxID=208375 RepID=UPI0035D4EF99
MAYQNMLENNRYVTVAKFYPATVGFGFAKDDPQLGQALKKALAELMADGTYQALPRKWNLPNENAIERPMINGQP